MSATNFAACDAKRRRYEGGLSMDRNDPGNWTGGRVGAGRLLGTKYGIAANSYPDIDIPSLTEAQAASLFRRDYWDKVAGDLQPVGVDLCVYDTAVNSGTGRAVQLQAQVLGNPSRNSATLARAAQAKGDYTAQVKALCAARLAFLHRLATFARYGKGWSARVADTEAAGVKMVLAAANLPAPVIQKKLEDEGRKAATKASDSGKAAGGTVLTGGGSGGIATAGSDLAHYDWTHWLALGAFALVFVLLLIFFLSKVQQHKARAAAYAAAAKEA